MCDYSLKQVQSRAAKVSDKLVTRRFDTGSAGLVSRDNPNVAVCLLPGAEVETAQPLLARRVGYPLAGVIQKYFGPKRYQGNTAKFTQINPDKPFVHHDALQFLDGSTVLINELLPGQSVRVLQVPAKPVQKEERGSSAPTETTVRELEDA